MIIIITSLLKYTGSWPCPGHPPAMTFYGLSVRRVSNSIVPTATRGNLTCFVVAACLRAHCYGQPRLSRAPLVLMAVAAKQPEDATERRSVNFSLRRFIKRFDGDDGHPAAAVRSGRADITSSLPALWKRSDIKLLFILHFSCVRCAGVSPYN